MGEGREWPHLVKAPEWFTSPKIAVSALPSTTQPAPYRRTYSLAYAHMRCGHSEPLISKLQNNGLEALPYLQRRLIMMETSAMKMAPYW